MRTVCFTSYLPQLLGRILRLGDAADPFATTKVLDAAAATGDFATAETVFSALHQPNLYMWTAMIRCYVAAKKHDLALEYYDQMRSSGIIPYKFSFVFLLKGCVFLGKFWKGSAAHGCVLKVGLEFDSFVRSALVKFYSSCGDVAAAHEVFREVEREENLVIWNAMISGFFANGEMERAKELFNAMPRRDLTSWNAAINWFSKMGNLEFARQLFDEMPEKDLVSWCSIVAGYVQGGRGLEALCLFKEMLKLGFGPDRVTLATALAACAQVGALDMGKWIHSYVDKNMVGYDVVLGTALIDMYSKCGNIDLALHVFLGMVVKNVATWNAMLCGLALHGRGSHALNLFQQMELARVPPTDITFVAVLSACSHVGAVDEGQRQFNRMCNELQIVPKMEHYGCMVDLLGRAGLINEARDFIVGMPVKPNVVILGSFLNACKMHGNRDPGDWFLRLITELDQVDSWCYVLLSNIHASRNQWNEVERLRRLTKGKGAQKIPGCSCIEVDNIVNEFSVDDRFNPQWKDVYETIGMMKTHLELGRYHTLSSEQNSFYLHPEVGILNEVHC